MDEEGCASLEDFSAEFRSRNRNLSYTKALNLLVEMEKIGLVERRIKYAGAPCRMHSYLWFKIGEDGKPLLPAFKPMCKRHLNPMQKAALYYGQFDD